MGGCMSSEAESPAAAHSKKIDQELKEEQKRMAKEVKLLLLGAGASGKSTILKQMKILNHQNFSAADKEFYRQMIFGNIVGGMRSVIDLMDELSMAVTDQNRQYISLVDNEPAISAGEAFPPRYLEALRALWNDPAVKECYSKGYEYSLQENLPYFYAEGKLESLFAPTFSPSNDDILRVRSKTTGISETRFMIKDITYRVFDVGGQRSERRKWASCFEGVTAILFLVALSDFNQGILEDVSQNGMTEALILFQSIASSTWFVKTSFILFLNKADLLMEKIKDPKQQIAPHFPDYAGKPGSYNDAVAFFRGKFRSLSTQPDREVYTYETTATDSRQVEVIWASVQDIIIRSTLRDMSVI